AFAHPRRRTPDPRSRGGDPPRRGHRHRAHPAVDPRHLRGGGDALLSRHRLHRPAGIHELHARRHLHARGGLDPAGGGPCPRRCVLPGCILPGPVLDPRGRGAVISPAPVRAHFLAVLGLRAVQLGDPREIQRGQRPALHLPAQNPALDHARHPDGPGGGGDPQEPAVRHGPGRRPCGREGGAPVMAEFIPLYMFAAVCLLLMLGYPVAFSLSGVALAFAAGGMVTGHFDMAFLHALPNRIYGTIINTTLIAVPLFVFMGVMLEKSKLAEDLLGNMSRLCGTLRGGLGISVILVGMLLAASTGIVGATVVTMGLMSLPSMLKQGYSPSLATGTICATGTLGQIIPPSIVLVLLGDILSTAYQQAQLKMGIFSPETVSIGDLFIAAIVPGLLLVLLY